MDIDEITVPDTLDLPEAADFLQYAEVRNAVEIETLGTDVITPGELELRAQFASNPHRRRRLFAVRRDGQMIACAIVTTRPHHLAAGAHLMVDVLPRYRREGVGAVVLDAIERVARDEGSDVLKVVVPHRVIDGGERIASPTAFGDLSAADPGARFLLAHGYSLEQVTRISLLEVPNSATERTVFDEETVSWGAEFGESDGYSIMTWVGPTPAEHLEDLAALRTRMSTDAPMAALAHGEDVWDGDRIASDDQTRVDGGQTMLTAATRDVRSGRLVGFTELAVASHAEVATQEDTLVLREHRGHGLGTRMKAATLPLLREHAPHVTAIVTWNAEENRPMLDVNEQMGFVAIGYEGGWLKRAE